MNIANVRNHIDILAFDNDLDLLEDIIQKRYLRKHKMMIFKSMNCIWKCIITVSQHQLDS
jgi:hypothetical protein